MLFLQLVTYHKHLATIGDGLILSFSDKNK